MRRSYLLFTAALAVALVGCDAAGPAATTEAITSQAKPDRAGFLITTLDADGNRSERRQEKVAVCHYDDETDSYELISVGAPAYDAHLRNHPDGVPGGEVPEADVTSTFGDDCEVIPAALPLGCTVERTDNGDGTETVVVTGILSEEERPQESALFTEAPGANGTFEGLGGRFGNVIEDGVVAGTSFTALFSAGSDDVIFLRVYDFDSGLALTCGPYIVSEIPLADPEA